jgi:hypothetical protein
MLGIGTDLALGSGRSWEKGEFMLQNCRQSSSRLEHYQGKVSVELPTYGHRFAVAGVVILLLAGLIAIT